MPMVMVISHFFTVYAGHTKWHRWVIKVLYHFQTFCTRSGWSYRCIHFHTAWFV